MTKGKKLSKQPKYSEMKKRNVLEKTLKTSESADHSHPGVLTDLSKQAFFCIPQALE